MHDRVPKLISLGIGYSLWRCPSCSVLDLGAGSGLLAMLAAQLGAREVLALEALLPCTL